MKNETKKKLHGLSYVKSMANFEAFCWNFSLSKNPQIVRSVHVYLPIEFGPGIIDEGQTRIVCKCHWSSVSEIHLSPF